VFFFFFFFFFFEEPGYAKTFVGKSAKKKDGEGENHLTALGKDSSLHLRASCNSSGYLQKAGHSG
jgi:hypothetical protein